MRFLTAEETSLDAFLSVSAASPFQEQLRDYTASLLRRRATRPSWCVLALESDVPVARAALWALPDAPAPTDVVLIEADWGEPDLAGGHALLRQVHELA